VINVLKDCFKCKRNEIVLVFTDDDRIAQDIIDDAKKLKAQAIIIKLFNDQRPITKIPLDYIQLLMRANIIMTPFKKYSLEKDFRNNIIKCLEVKEVEARLAHMPNVSADIYENCVKKSNYDEIEEIGGKIVNAFSVSKKVTIVSGNGKYSISLNCGDFRKIDLDYGKIYINKMWNNLPAGEIFTIPLLEATSGEIEINGAIPIKFCDKNYEYEFPGKDDMIVLKFENGILTDINGKKNATLFRRVLKKIEKLYGNESESIYKIGEFGIGLNDAARKSKIMIENEKRKNTIHIALGENTHLGGDFSGPPHMDLVVENPIVFFDKVKILDGNKLLLENIESISNIDLSKYDIADYKSDKKMIYFEDFVEILKMGIFFQWHPAGNKKIQASYNCPSEQRDLLISICKILENEFYDKYNKYDKIVGAIMKQGKIEDSLKDQVIRSLLFLEEIEVLCEEGFVSNVKKN
jgi:leucyl aminopeptidase (aminopeptidase T)